MLRETLPFSPLSARYRPTVYHLRPPDYSLLTKLSTIQVYRHPHVSFTFQYHSSILQTLTHRMTSHTLVHTRTPPIFLGRGGREEKDSSIFVRYVTANRRMAAKAAAHHQIYRRHARRAGGLTGLGYSVGVGYYSLNKICAT